VGSRLMDPIWFFIGLLLAVLALAIYSDLKGWWN
jgi:hypothetical protein